MLDRWLMSCYLMDMSQTHTTRYTYRDHNGRHWIDEDDLDTMIIQNAQENVCDLGGHPDIVGWDEYGRRVKEMITAIIESRIADGEDIR